MGNTFVAQTNTFLCVEAMDPFNRTVRQEHAGWWYAGKRVRFRVSWGEGGQVCIVRQSTSELDGRRWSVIRDCWSQLHRRKWIPSSAGEQRGDKKTTTLGIKSKSQRGSVSWVMSLTPEKEPLRSHWLKRPVIKEEKKRPLKVRKTRRKHPTPTTAVTVHTLPPAVKKVSVAWRVW